MREKPMPKAILDKVRSLDAACNAVSRAERFVNKCFPFDENLPTVDPQVINSLVESRKTLKSVHDLLRLVQRRVYTLGEESTNETLK